MKYLAIDPGETSGLTTLETDGNHFLYAEVASLKELWRAINIVVPDVIICEDFDRREKPGRIAPIIEGIGIVKLYSQQTFTPVEFQSASYGKAFWDNGKLKQVGVYREKMKHANDATRHVLQYMTQKEKDYHWINKLRPPA